MCVTFAPKVKSIARETQVGDCLAVVWLPPGDEFSFRFEPPEFHCRPISEERDARSACPKIAQ
jgi:hypothetical protein